MAIGLNPEWYGAHLSLANSYKMIGCYKLALEEYERALELNEDKDIVEKADRKYILKQINLLARNGNTSTPLPNKIEGG